MCSCTPVLLHLKINIFESETHKKPVIQPERGLFDVKKSNFQIQAFHISEGSSLISSNHSL